MQLDFVDSNRSCDVKPAKMYREDEGNFMTSLKDTNANFVVGLEEKSRDRERNQKTGF